MDGIEYEYVKTDWYGQLEPILISKVVLVVQMNCLKLILDEQMAENVDFRLKRPPKWSRWPPVDDIEYEKLVGMINGNLS